LVQGDTLLAKAKIKRLYLIPILSKALDVIELLEQHHAPLTLEDVYQKTHISKTSVYRILKTLVHRGYLAQSQNGQYRRHALLRGRGSERDFGSGSFRRGTVDPR
jgi:ribose transport system substrate-binding protein